MLIAGDKREAISSGTSAASLIFPDKRILGKRVMRSEIGYRPEARAWTGLANYRAASAEATLGRPAVCRFLSRRSLSTVPHRGCGRVELDKFTRPTSACGRNQLIDDLANPRMKSKFFVIRCSKDFGREHPEVEVLPAAQELTEHLAATGRARRSAT